MTILKSSIVLLAVSGYASRLSKMHEDKMEHDAMGFDEDILNFDEDEDFDEDWHPDELDEGTRNERFEKLIHRMDTNNDKFIDKKELIQWTLKALMSMDAREVGSDFETADEDEDGLISFDEYVKNIFGIDDVENMDSRLDENYELQDFNRQFHREQARWAAADTNNDGKLDEKEYELFYNPSQEQDFISVALAEAIPRIDANDDGKIDEAEYMNDFKTPWVGTDEWLQNEKETFQDLDLDKSGYLDSDLEKELWLLVDNGEISIDEADHLINVSDKDDDDKLSYDEVKDAMQDFIDSDATEYGFQLRHDEL